MQDKPETTPFFTLVRDLLAVSPERVKEREEAEKVARKKKREGKKKSKSKKALEALETGQANKA